MVPEPRRAHDGPLCRLLHLPRLPLAPSRGGGHAWNLRPTPFSNPYPDSAGFLDAHPSADLFISTDCLSYRAEAEGTPDVWRCGHVPGSTGNYAYNTGMLILRRRLATLQIMRDWHHRLATPTKCAASVMQTVGRADQAVGKIDRGHDQKYR